MKFILFCKSVKLLAALYGYLLVSIGLLLSAVPAVNMVEATSAGCTCKPDLSCGGINVSRLDWGIRKSTTSSAELSRLKEISCIGLSGPIPTGLWSELKSLEKMDFSDNSLSGALPSHIGSVTTLRVLILEGNDFSGTLPKELNSLNNLEDVRLGFNAFTGQVPDLDALTKLKRLSLLPNQFVGEYPGLAKECIPCAYIWVMWVFLPLSFFGIIHFISETICQCACAKYSVREDEGGNANKDDLTALPKASSSESITSLRDQAGESNKRRGIACCSTIEQIVHNLIYYLFIFTKKYLKFVVFITAFFSFLVIGILCEEDRNKVSVLGCSEILQPTDTDYIVSETTTKTFKLPKLSSQVFPFNNACRFSESITLLVKEEYGSGSTVKNEFGKSWLALDCSRAQLLFSDRYSAQLFEVLFNSLNSNRLRRLESIDISRSGFNGTLAVNIGSKLPSVRTLDLSFNRFGGRLPSDITKLVQLRSLRVENNVFTGVLPSNMPEKLPYLEELFIFPNRFLYETNIGETRLPEFPDRCTSDTDKCDVLWWGLLMGPISILFLTILVECVCGDGLFSVEVNGENYQDNHGKELETCCFGHIKLNESFLSRRNLIGFFLFAMVSIVIFFAVSVDCEVNKNPVCEKALLRTDIYEIGAPPTPQVFTRSPTKDFRPPHSRPTPAPTKKIPWREKKPDAFAGLIIGFPLALIMVLWICGNRRNYANSAVIFLISNYDFIGDICYVRLESFSSPALFYSYIAVMVLPGFSFLFFSPAQPYVDAVFSAVKLEWSFYWKRFYEFSREIREEGDSGCGKNIEIFLYGILVFILSVLLVAAQFVTTLLAAAVFALSVVYFKFLCIPYLASKVNRNAVAFANNYEYYNENTKTMAEKEAYSDNLISSVDDNLHANFLLNVAVFLTTFLQSMPTLIIAIINNHIGEYDSPPLFLFTVIGSSLSILKSALPYMVTCIIKMSIVESMKLNRFYNPGTTS